MNFLRKAITFFVCVLCLCTVFAQAGMTAERVKVRVAFPLLNGFSYVKDGIYGGYVYDYLQEISHYTGWEYEFVTVEGSMDEQLLTLSRMVQDGRLDIIGVVLRTEETARMFDFPEFSAGSKYSTLSVLRDDVRFDDMDYSSFASMRVGMIKSASRSKQSMLRFFGNYGINPRVIEYVGSNEMSEALEKKEIDALLNNDLSLKTNERILTRFSGEPYYFVTTKGNKYILNGLNSAMAKIRDANPNLAKNLYEKHFHLMTNFPFYMTPQERAYVNKADVIRVVTSPDWAPIQDIDQKTGDVTGVMKDVLDYISMRSGLRFEIIPTRSYAESLDKIAAGEADILLGVTGNEKFAIQNNLVLSTAVMPLQMVTVRHKDADLSQADGKKILALPYGFTYSKPFPEEDIRRYDNLEQCLEAVNGGEVDLCYGTSLSLAYYARNQYYDNISLVESSGDPCEMKIAFVKPVPAELLIIVNKAILSLPKERLQGFIDKNTILGDKETTLRALLRGNPALAISIILIISIVIITAVVYSAMNRVRHNRKALLNNERYRLLSELSNEYIYEYDYINDVFSASDKLVRLCGCLPSIKDFLSCYDERNRGKFLGEGFADSLLGKDIVSEFCLETMGGDYWVRNSCSTIFDAYHRPVRRIGKLIDITAEKQEREGLIEKAQNDSLTNIFNKGTTEMLVEDYLRNCRAEEKALLVFFDVDNFKYVNDTFGHIFGDKVLQDVAKTLKVHCREHDIAGRVGGDEFVVLLKNVNLAEIYPRAERLGHVLRIVYPEQRYSVGISMGVTVVSGDDTYTKAAHRADLALYKAKEMGKNRHCFYDPAWEKKRDVAGDSLSEK